MRIKERKNVGKGILRSETDGDSAQHLIAIWIQDAMPTHNNIVHPILAVLVLWNDCANVRRLGPIVATTMLATGLTISMNHYLLRNFWRIGDSRLSQAAGCLHVEFGRV